MGNQDPEDPESLDDCSSNASSQSLINSHVHSLQLQLSRVRSELSQLTLIVSGRQEVIHFLEDRCSNLETQRRTLHETRAGALEESLRVAGSINSTLGQDLTHTTAQVTTCQAHRENPSCKSYRLISYTMWQPSQNGGLAATADMQPLEQCPSTCPSLVGVFRNIFRPVNGRVLGPASDLPPALHS